MSISKDSKVEDLRIDQKELQLQADLVGQTSEAPSIVSMSGVLASRVISIDVKEPVKSCQKVQIIDRSTGKVASASLSAAPVISGNSISVTIDATGLSNVCICVSYRN